MEKFNNNAKIMVDYGKGLGVYIKGNLTRNEMYTLDGFIKDYKCRTKIEIAFCEIRIHITGKNNIELLQNEDFKNMFLVNPSFNVLENL